MDMLRIGDKVNHCFLVTGMSEGETKRQTKYLSLDIRNRYLVCNTKVWDWESIKADLDHEIHVGGFVRISGEVEHYQGQTQIKLSNITTMLEQDVDMEHIVEVPVRSLSELENELNEYLKKIQNPVLLNLCESVIANKKLYQLFCTRPAALQLHHSTRHGLLEHTVSMMSFASVLQSNYDFLSLDLLLAGCLFHDIGKIVEINDVLSGTYSDRGRLLGHISIGISLIDHLAETLGYKGKEEVDLLKHMVISHHGKNEWGSPIEPRLLEAVALHMIDYYDATFYRMFRQMKDIKIGEWTSNRAQSYLKHSLSLVDQKDYYRK